MTDQTVELDSVETRMGKKTIELHHVSKCFGEKKILDDFSYIVLSKSAAWNYRAEWLWKIYDS